MPWRHTRRVKTKRRLSLDCPEELKRAYNEGQRVLIENAQMSRVKIRPSIRTQSPCVYQVSESGIPCEGMASVLPISPLSLERNSFTSFRN